MSSEKLKSSFRKKIADHQSLTSSCIVLLTRILAENKIDVLSVTGRTKDLSSVLEKIRRKRYSHPEVQMTDLSGIRVIVFFESQVSLVSDIIRTTFDVDESNSVDRDTILGDDRIGYRSVHFVCSLGENRKELPEYQNICGLKFEIQVRTVLQHAWAELAHDRTYKFSSELPGNLQRKLNLYSGMLEVVDRGFDEVSNEIDQYASKVEKSRVSVLENDRIDSINIQKVIDELREKENIIVKDNLVDKLFISELNSYGIEDVSDLVALFGSDFVDSYRKKLNGKSTTVGFVRDAMMYNDLEKYFNQSWPVSPWSLIDEPCLNFLESKYGNRVREIINERDISVDDEDFFFDE